MNELQWCWTCWALIGWGTATGLAVGVIKLLRNLNRKLIREKNSQGSYIEELRATVNELRNRRVIILRASMLQPKHEMDRLHGMDREKTGGLPQGKNHSDGAGSGDAEDYFGHCRNRRRRRYAGVSI